MLATFVYIAAVLTLFAWLWTKLKKAKSPQESELPGVPDNASQLANSRDFHCSVDHSSSDSCD